jgi:hypothetical protein
MAVPFPATDRSVAETLARVALGVRIAGGVAVVALLGTVLVGGFVVAERPPGVVFPALLAAVVAGTFVLVAAEVAFE